MSCEVYFAEMSHFTPFSHPLTQVPLLKVCLCVWVCINYFMHARVCVSVLTCLCAYGFVALCLQSPCCQHMVSGRVKLQTAAFCSTEGLHLIREHIRMCVVEVVLLWSSAQHWACRRTGYQLCFLIICSAAYQRQIRELAGEWFSLQRPCVPTSPLDNLLQE